MKTAKTVAVKVETKTTATPIAPVPAPLVATAKPKPVKVAKAPKTKPASDGNPYRAGTMYNVLFEVGSQGYQTPAQICATVAKRLHWKVETVGFGLSVLRQPKHRSNGKRSKEVTQGDKIKLVAIKK